MPPRSLGHLRIGDGADGLLHLVIGDALQEGQRARPQHFDLAERGFVEHRHALAGGLMLRADGRRPEAAGPAIGCGPVLAFGQALVGGEPVGRSQLAFWPKTTPSPSRR